MERLPSAIVVAIIAMFMVYYLPVHIFSSWISVSVYASIFAGTFYALTHHHAAPSTADYDRITAKVFEAVREDSGQTLVRLLAKSLRFDGDRNVLKELNEDGRTALHLAAELGHTESAETIIHFLKTQQKKMSKYLEREDAAACTPLMLAIVRGHTDTAVALLRLGCRPDTKGPKSRNSLFLACLTGQSTLVQIMREQLDKKTFVSVAREPDALGYTCTHAACLAGSVDTLNVLLSEQAADLASAARDGSTPLHTAARRGEGTVVRLLALHGARLTACRFGCTPLHTACIHGRVDAVRELVRSYPMAALVAQDHDGLHPLHSTVQALGTAAAKPAPSPAAGGAESEQNEQVDNLLSCFRILVEAGYPIDCKDYSNATVVYLLCWSADKPQLSALSFLFQYLESNNRTLDIAALLRAKADSGWTCMHAAKHMPGPASSEVLALLQRLAGEYAPEMVTMELSATRDKTNAGYLTRRGAHNTVPEDERRQVLRGEHTLAGVSRYLRRIVSTGRAPRIVVLCGAGMSTSAGIKDFRSSSGVYAERGMSRVFTADFFENNPKEFYEAALSAFGPISALASVRPTPAHALLRVLRDAGWLLRVYTQNIDHLERKVGLQPEEIVECHGSLFRTVCRACNARNESPDHVAQFWRAIEEKHQPVCACGGLLRPDVVLFGEPLPTRFHQLAYADVAACDLLLVLGTSLVVYPVASLPSFVGQLVPRVLINREPSGCFQNVPPCNSASATQSLLSSSTSGPSASQEPSALSAASASAGQTETSASDGAQGVGAHYRDVFYQGGCDEGAIEFAESLGLGTALAAVIAH